MGRSRYLITELDKPHFMTCTVLEWLPVFTRPETFYRSHALRGNASCNAPALRKATLERRGRHSHAERGNDVLSTTYSLYF